MKKGDIVYCKKDCHEYIENGVYTYEKGQWYAVLEYEKVFDRFLIGDLWMTSYSEFFEEHFSTIKETRKQKLKQLNENR